MIFCVVYMCICYHSPVIFLETCATYVHFKVLLYIICLTDIELETDTYSLKRLIIEVCGLRTVRFEDCCLPPFLLQ